VTTPFDYDANPERFRPATRGAGIGLAGAGTGVVFVLSRPTEIDS
jgi:hypothetical protein